MAKFTDQSVSIAFQPYLQAGETLTNAAYRERKNSMNRVSIIVPLMLLLVSCAKTSSPPAPAGNSSSREPTAEQGPTSNGGPIKTSIGDLTSLEKRDSVETSDQKISPKSGEVLYLLTFEGKSEITYEGKAQQDGPNRILLLDDKGKEYSPEYAGSPKSGTLSDKDWKYNGGMKAANGKFVFSGTMTLPEPRIALVFLVPKDAAKLSLKDGDQKHSID